MKKFFSPKEVASMFNISLPTIYRLMNKREITFFKIGGIIRFSEEDVNQYLENNKHDWLKLPKL